MPPLTVQATGPPKLNRAGPILRSTFERKELAMFLWIIDIPIWLFWTILVLICFGIVWLLDRL